MASSFLQEQLDEEELSRLNAYLGETEQLQQVEMDGATVAYKERLVEVFKDVEDPMGVMLGEVNFEQNPADPQ